jgi:hypothetical protein
MGTSGAYSGSGGSAWQDARDAAGELINDPTSSEKQEATLADLANALDWDGSPDGEGQPDNRPEDEQTIAPEAPSERPFGRLVRPRGGGGGFGGGGAGGGTRGGGPGGGRGGKGRRSRRRSARVGGAVLAAGVALRQGDAATLNALGFSLSELAGLSPLAQCNRILKALVGSGGDIDESEMLAASSTALITILIEDAPPDQAVRLFIVEYVMQVATTELGATLRTGAGEISVQIEDELRSLVVARTDQIELDEDRLGPGELQDALYEALGVVKEVLKHLK